MNNTLNPFRGALNIIETKINLYVKDNIQATLNASIFIGEKIELIDNKPITLIQKINKIYQNEKGEIAIQIHNLHEEDISEEYSVEDTYFNSLNIYQKLIVVDVLSQLIASLNNSLTNK